MDGWKTIVLLGETVTFHGQKVGVCQHDDPPSGETKMVSLWLWNFLFSWSRSPWESWDPYLTIHRCWSRFIHFSSKDSRYSKVYPNKGPQFDLANWRGDISWMVFRWNRYLSRCLGKITFHPQLPESLGEQIWNFTVDLRSVKPQLLEGSVLQGSLNYSFWGDQTMQMCGNFGGFPL